MAHIGAPHMAVRENVTVLLPSLRHWHPACQGCRGFVGPVPPPLWMALRTAVNAGDASRVKRASAVMGGPTGSCATRVTPG
jgi:hypothetical protein